METQSIILYTILYTFFSIFQKKKRLKRQEKARKKKNVYLYTGRQEIISSLVRYVTAHDTHAIRKKLVPEKNYISLVKYFTPHDTKFILLQNNRNGPINAHLTICLGITTTMKNKSIAVKVLSKCLQ